MVKVIFEGECCEDCMLMIANGDGEQDTADAIAKRHPIGHAVMACAEDCEGWFSWRACEACGSSLGGNRHPFAVLS